MNTNDILPDVACIGYYWMSDQTDPTVIDRERTPSRLREALADPGRNPFVVEAQLYFPEKRLSAGIRYVDGDYVVRTHTVVENVEDIRAGRRDDITLKRYAAHRMPGRRLIFLQYWKEEEDALCGRMPVLQPAEMAFIGFESYNKEEGK